jgi:hypothetical protein
MTKYGVQFIVVLGCIGKIKVYTAEGQKLEDTLFSLLDSNCGQNHHVFQAIFIIV